MLWIFAFPIACGIALGYLRGGKLRVLGQLRIEALWLVWVAVAIQACHLYVPAVRRFAENELGLPLLLVVFGSVGLWIGLNLGGRSLGVWLAIVMLLIGGILNGLAILANGRMPFSQSAALHARLPRDKIFPVDRLPKNEPASADTRIPILGDIIPVRPIHRVISIGDVILAIGIALIIAAGMRGQPSGHPRGAVHGDGPLALERDGRALLLYDVGPTRPVRFPLSPTRSRRAPIGWEEDQAFSTVRRPGSPPDAPPQAGLRHGRDDR